MLNFEFGKTIIFLLIWTLNKATSLLGQSLIPTINYFGPCEL